MMEKLINEIADLIRVNWPDQDALSAIRSEFDDLEINLNDVIASVERLGDKIRDAENDVF